MKMHAIIEIEEGSLNIVVGGREGGHTKVVRSLRVPLSDLTAATIETALRSVSGDVLQGATGVHVVIGDRRSQHFLSTLPKMPPRDAIAYVTREALRLGNLQSAEDILVSTRLVRVLPGNKMQLGSTAVPRSIWRPIEEALTNHGLQILGLHTIESCLAMTTDPDFSEPVAVLDCNGSRARYVVSVDQTPVQVRRFMIGGGAGGEVNEASMMTQLAMELPRTIDWLRETGQALPRRTAVGTRVGISQASLEMLVGEETGELGFADCKVQWAAELIAPGLGVAGLLERLASGRKMQSLLDVPKLSLPMGSRHLVSMAAAVCVTVLAGYSAVVDGTAWLETCDQAGQVESECQELEMQIEDVEMGSEPTVASGANPALDRALTMRRPVSRLISEVSNSAGDGIRLEEIRFASKSPIVISGQVEGASRQDALAAMGAFTQKVHAMDFVVARGQDEVSEVEGLANRFRFQLNLSWRN